MITINRTLKNKNSDIIGALASSLCLIHCMATPFVFIAQASVASDHHHAPIWWKSIDFIFIGISFFAVYWSAKNTIKSWVKFALWMSWIGLCLVILNEKLEWLPLPEGTIYIPAIALIAIHLYNKKYCQC
ncbi:MerC domain-containing protein [Winogradskyella sp.]|uniref:MerC domain-containing protein n=1 Tax=Winogradskyella sp. TaxID=1883156 RepID=UPI002636176E|nr:MerC domain-containing protein [Winogradskyella sp.]